MTRRLSQMISQMQYEAAIQQIKDRICVIEGPGENEAELEALNWVLELFGE